MSHLFQQFSQQSQYVDRKSGFTRETWNEKIQKSTTVYVGNLSFYTTEDQIYEFFSLCGDIDIVVMGLNKRKKNPCGFCFIRFFTHQVAARAANLLNGASLDFRPIRVDWDTGDNIDDTRCYGRGITGGQRRDDFRQTYDQDRGGEGGGINYTAFIAERAKKRRRATTDQQWDRYGYHDAKRPFVSSDMQFLKEISDR